MRSQIFGRFSSSLSAKRGTGWGVLLDILLIALILRMPLLTVAATPLFDESFYLPAAKALLAGHPDTNPEQPPLAKLLIAGSIAIFGDNPLGWRLPSLFAGLASVALLYLISLQLTKSKTAAAVAASLMALDPLHIVLSRVAMLDIFMLAFGLAGTYVLLNIGPARDDGGQNIKQWATAGILFGLAIASKWPAAFMLAGVLAFLLIDTRHRHHLLVPITILLATAAVVYTATYIPFIMASGPQAFVDRQLSNINYHLSLSADKQASPPWAWLLGRKPVWFGWNKPGFPVPDWLLFIPNALHTSAAFAVIALANPLIWWPAEVALLLLAVRWLKSRFTKRKVTAGTRLSNAEKFALIWFLATWLPWLLSPRAQTFLYYMLPVLPALFITLATFVQRNPHRWAVPALFAAAVLGLLIFYPLTILLPMPAGYIEALRWWIGIPPPPL
jgi:dolichyl-phosphate-mannose--protein O-mannosyl transferase